MRPSKAHSNRRSRSKRRPVIPLQVVPAGRIKLVFTILCLGLVGLSVRMAWLQVLQAPELEARARAFQIKQTKPLGTRRSIVDRNGRLVALDEERYRLWAHPRYFNFPGDEVNLLRKPIEVARKLSGILAIPMADLVDRLGDRASGVKLVDDLDSDVAEQIRELGISGLDLEPYPQRIYPQGHLFANVVGFLNQDRIPQAGLEQSRHKELLRFEQPKSMRLGADGTPLPDDLSPGIFYGDDLKLQLTLDARLQQLALEALSEQVKKWKAKKGSAIVMDVINGELLVLASTPTYDPNNYWQYDPALFREWAVQDLFEPGSTFKPINLALALQEGVIRPEGKVNDSGILKIGGWPIYNHNSQVHGVIDFPKLLQVSSNVGMVKIMRKIKPSIYWDWLSRLGLDSSPDTDLPGAIAGQLKTKEEFVLRPIEPATASFGQGFSLTPLKLVQLHALIANGGYLVSPHITRGLRSGDSLAPRALPRRNPLLRPHVTRIVREWMESVVEKGSGQGVRTPGYRIGGKTGTAQKAFDGIYQSDVKICSFVASLPADKPRFVVLVVVDEPKGRDAFGSTVAVPVAKQIIDALLVLEKIPPSNYKAKLQAFKN